MQHFLFLSNIFQNKFFFLKNFSFPDIQIEIDNLKFLL